MSSAALHVFIKSNRANIVEILGLYKQEETKKNVYDPSPDNIICMCTLYKINLIPLSYAHIMFYLF